MSWSLYNHNGEALLLPLKHANGKTQEDVVNEVLQSIKNSHKVIFIKGQCGSGKCLSVFNEISRHF